MSEAGEIRDDRAPEYLGGFSTTAAWRDVWRSAFRADAFDWISSDGTIVPVYTTQRRVAGIPLRIVHSATNEHTASWDIAGAADGEDFVRELLVDTDCDMLVADFVEDSARVVDAIRRSGLAYRSRVTSRSSVTDCSGRIEDWWESRVPKVRNDWRRRRHRLDERGVQFACERSWSGVEPIFDELLAVEGSGWKAKAGTAIRQSGVTTTFYRELCRRAAEMGALRLYHLRLDGRVVAFQIDILWNGSVWNLKVGYLEEERRSAVGVVLQQYVFEDVFADLGVDRFDFLGGALEPALYTVRYASEFLDRSRFTVFAPTWRGRLAWARLGPGTDVLDLVRPPARSLVALTRSEFASTRRQSPH